jgi:hypothetical protein
VGWLSGGSIVVVAVFCGSCGCLGIFMLLKGKVLISGIAGVGIV